MVKYFTKPYFNAVTFALFACLLFLGCNGTGGTQVKTPADPAEAEEIPITINSEEALALFQKGEAKMDRRMPLDANKIFTELVAKDPDCAYGYLNLANNATSTQEYASNVRLALEKSNKASKGERMLIQIANTFLTNENEKRLKLAEDLVKEYPKSMRAWLNLAGVQAVRNDFAGERKSALKAMELNPDNPAPLFALGNSYLFNEPKDFDMAVSYFKKLVKKFPEAETGHIYLGDCYRARQELPEAVKSYAKAAEINPENAIAWIKKGHVNSFMGEYIEARFDYDESLKRAFERQKADFANYKAFTFLHEGKPQEAVSALQEVVDNMPEFGIPDHQQNGARIFALSNMANIALHSGMVQDAEKCISMLKTDLDAQAETIGTDEFSRNQGATKLLWEGLLEAYKGNYDSAEAKAAEIETILSEDDDPRKLEGYHYLMGVVSYLKKDFEMALDHLKQADHKNTIYIKYHLAKAYDGVGNAEEADRLFKEVATWNFNSVGFALVRKDALSQYSES